ncbi:kelch-like protein 18 [Paramacrobiotus metropolitanus]|uniref:kelch-like protein 18 n=1 Tax=Paramacrobiotus metropolitanus TaxID=2943436 RepID=UPI0024460D6D|nr:kelch-like protein 18 [Paramacrobiotus metropolitanus]
MAEAGPSNPLPSRKRLRLPEDGATVSLDAYGLVQGLNDVRSELCDVELRGAPPSDAPAEPSWIPCHRIVLMARSQFFRAMFRSEMMESQKKDLPLPNIPHSILEQIIGAMYGHPISLEGLEDSGAFALAQAADYLEIPQIVRACTTLLRTRLEVDNPRLEIYNEAVRLALVDLADECRALIGEHFIVMTLRGDLASLTSDAMIHLIRSDQLYVACEDQVADAVWRWLTVPDCAEQRHPLADELFQHLRLTLLSNGFLARLPEHPLAQRLAKAAEDATEAALADIDAAANSRPSLRVSYETVIVAVHHLSGMIDCVDSKTGKCESVPFAPPPPNCAFPPLYIPRGHQIAIATMLPAEGGGMVVMTYDASVDRWSGMGTCGLDVNQASLAVVGGHQYAVGGQQLYCYYDELQEWQLKAGKPTTVWESGIVAHGGFLYLFSGVVSSVE